MGNCEGLKLTVQLFSNYNGPCCIRLRQNNGKFFTPIAGHQILRSLTHLLGSLGNLHQTRIPRLVTVGIIKPLEVIHIK